MKFIKNTALFVVKLTAAIVAAVNVLRDKNVSN